MTLTEHLIEHFKQHRGEWLKKGSLYALSDEWFYSPETLGRELRTLSEDPTSGITVKYYTGNKKQKLAMYCFDAPVEKKLVIKIINGQAVKFYE